MERSEHSESDLLFFFDGKPLELGLYEALFARMEAAFPQASVKVQKSQVSFYQRHLFAAASLPVRRKKTFIAEFYKYSFVGVLLDWIRQGMAADHRLIAEKIAVTMRGNVTNSIHNFAEPG